MFGKQNNQEPDLEFFTVFDSKSKSYSEPFPSKNREVVIREFANAFKKEDAAKSNRYFQNAEDFAIFKVGSFDLRTGTLSSQNPEHIVNMHDLRAAVTPGALLAT